MYSESTLIELYMTNNMDIYINREEQPKINTSYVEEGLVVC